MNHNIQPAQWPPHGEICCSVEQSVGWLDCLAEMAVDGDNDARAALPQAVDHYLSAVSETALDAEEWPR